MTAAPVLAITATTRVVHAPPPPRGYYATPCVAVRRGGRVVARWLLTRNGAWVRSAFVVP